MTRKSAKVKDLEARKTKSKIPNLILSADSKDRSEVIDIRISGVEVFGQNLSSL